MVAQYQEHTAIGPQDTFHTLRQYWGEVMGAHAHTEQDLLRWGHDNPMDADGRRLTPEAVMTAVKEMRKASVGGLDGWPVGAVCHLTHDICVTLIALWDACARTLCWPTSVHHIRTQLIPKKHDGSYHVEDLRPISVMSAWYRLWGRCVLSLHSDVLERFDNHLRGGVPAWSMSDSVLAWALEVESAIRSIPSMANPERPTDVLSIDAVKCFDRIRQCQVLDYAKRFRFCTNTLRQLAGFHFSVQRILSYSARLDRFAYHPGVGIPQGCALSACLCNVLMHDWTQRTLSAQGTPSVFIDDRAISAASSESL